METLINMLTINHRERNPYVVEGDIIKVSIYSKKLYELKGIAIMDAKFEYLVKAYNFRLDDNGYVVVSMRVNGKHINKRLHKLVTDTGANIMIDHIDGNPLNNCLSNLRRATRSQNGMNRKRASNSTTGVSGVYMSGKKFCSQIKFNGKTYHLGTHKTKRDAVLTRLTAEAKFFGVFCNRENFNRLIKEYCLEGQLNYV